MVVAVLTALVPVLTCRRYDRYPATTCAHGCGDEGHEKRTPQELLYAEDLALLPPQWPSG